MRTSKLIDGVVWDGKNPKAYAASFKIKARCGQAIEIAWIATAIFALRGALRAEPGAPRSGRRHE